MDYVTVRIWEDTRRLLRLLAADSGEQMVEVMDRLCREEIAKRGLNVANERGENKKRTDLPRSNAE
jgi:hypothetical protein